MYSGSLFLHREGHLHPSWMHFVVYVPMVAHGVFLILLFGTGRDFFVSGRI
jgi:hypothetical protein